MGSVEHIVPLRFPIGKLQCVKRLLALLEIAIEDPTTTDDRSGESIGNRRLP